MQKTILQFNLEKLLEDKGWDVETLCKSAGLSLYEVEIISSKPMVSVTNKVVQKICKTLECTTAELFTNDGDFIPEQEEPTSSTIDEQYKKLLSSFANIDLDLFLESVAKVDEIIDAEGKILSSHDKAKAYLAFYELADRLLDGSN